MPFKKVDKDTYESPSGRKFNSAQVRMYYARGGSFPGQKGMGDQFPKSYNSATSRTLTSENSDMKFGGQSPSATGAAARPSFVQSGREDPISPTPTSILSSGPSTFAPLEYSQRDKSNQEFWRYDRQADRELRRARREFGKGKQITRDESPEPNGRNGKRR